MCCPNMAASKVSIHFSDSCFCFFPFPNHLSLLGPSTHHLSSLLQSIVCGCLSCNRKLPLLSSPWASSSLVGQRNQKKTTETHRHHLLSFQVEVNVTGRFPARPRNITMPLFRRHQPTRRMTGIRLSPSSPPASSHHRQDGVRLHHNPSLSTNITTISALRVQIPHRHNLSSQYHRFRHQRTAPGLSPRCPWGR